MSPWVMLQRLYEFQIVRGLQMDQDAGVLVWLGDQWNGKVAEKLFSLEELEGIAIWLDQQARKRFPKSHYAKQPKLQDVELSDKARQLALAELRESVRKPPKRIDPRISTDSCTSTVPRRIRR